MFDKIRVKLRYILRGDSDISRLKKMGLRIGENYNFQGGVTIDKSHCFLIDIGNNVTMAPNVLVLAHDASTKKYIGYTKIARVKIGNNVFIGADSVILPGVKIGDNTIIGAGSVVSKDIPEGSVACGVPAKIICSTNEYIKKNREQMKKKPCYGEEYQYKVITREQIDEMREAVDTANGGYIV